MHFFFMHYGVFLYGCLVAEPPKVGGSAIQNGWFGSSQTTPANPKPLEVVWPLPPTEFEGNWATSNSVDYGSNRTTPSTWEWFGHPNSRRRWASPWEWFGRPQPCHQIATPKNHPRRNFLFFCLVVKIWAIHLKWTAHKKNVLHLIQYLLHWTSIRNFVRI